jgi:DNA mismatch repair protein MutS
LKKGYHVAICEQVGDQPARGLFPRQVTRVVTPGTIIEPGLLQSIETTTLSALWFQEDGAGFSYVDISTGEFSATQFSG